MKNVKKIYSFILSGFKPNKKEAMVFKCGFTLIETLVSVFLFSLIALMIAGSFTAFLKNYEEAKRMQRNIDNAQFAINLMAKTIRTSDVVLVDANNLGCFDYAQSKCVLYSYASSTKKLQVSEGTASNLAGCNFASMSSLSDITSTDIVAAYFNVVPSTTPTYGKVTTALSVREATQTTSPLNIQQTASLRNYKSN